MDGGRGDVDGWMREGGGKKGGSDGGGTERKVGWRRVG